MGNTKQKKISAYKNEIKSHSGSCLRGLESNGNEETSENLKEGSLYAFQEIRRS